MLFSAKLTNTFKRPFSFREKRAKTKRVDVMAEQVRKILQDTDQKIILMVRG